MKKILLLCFAISACLFINAQTAPKTDSLDAYTGKYKMAAGAPVSEITITIESGVLFASSDAGNSELKRIEGDVFEVVAYAGKATFKRNPEGKVTGVKVEVEDTVMEGTKDGVQYQLEASLQAKAY